MNHKEEKIKALPLIQDHRIGGYQKRLEWVRVAITILTPSLVLLIGLQDKPLPCEKLLSILLLISISLMTLSILIGLWLLLGESRGHSQAVADIKEWVETGKRIDDLPTFVKSPWHQNIFWTLFSIFVWLSILSLGAFGLLKYL
jgi:hypothetical protein